MKKTRANNKTTNYEKYFNSRVDKAPKEDELVVETDTYQSLNDFDENFAHMNDAHYEQEFNDMFHNSNHKVFNDNLDDAELLINNSEASDDERWHFIKQSDKKHFVPFLGDQDGLDDVPLTMSSLSKHFDSMVPSKIEEFLETPFQAPLKYRHDSSIQQTKQDKYGDSVILKESSKVSSVEKDLSKSFEENNNGNSFNDSEPFIEVENVLTEVVSAHSEDKRKSEFSNDTPTEKRYNMNKKYDESKFEETKLAKNQEFISDISTINIETSSKLPKTINKKDDIVQQLKCEQSRTFNGEEDLQTKNIVQGKEYQIDLEIILKIEQKLWSILDSFTQEASKTNVFEFCEEWWDLVDSTMLSNIHSIFSD